jgi:hypothetical protein
MDPSKFPPRAHVSRGKNGSGGRQLARLVVGKRN